MKDVNWIVICIPVQLQSSLVIISLFGWTGRLVVLQKKKEETRTKKKSDKKEVLSRPSLSRRRKEETDRRRSSKIHVPFHFVDHECGILIP